MSNIKFLDKIGYVCRPPISATYLDGNAFLANDTIAYNTNSKTAPNNALKWAEYGGWGKNVNFIPKPYEITNDPFKIKIIGLDIRSQGGRAYKVIDDKNRRFDLREDQVFEIIRLCGIEKGGQVSIPVVWGMLGSQIRLVLVGGKLYNKMMERI